MRFCPECTNCLDDVTTRTELYYQCTKCKKKIQRTDEDTLRFRQKFSNEEDTTKNTSMLNNAAFDNTNPAIYKDCIKCPKKIVRYVRVGDSMKYVFVCKCGAIF